MRWLAGLLLLTAIGCGKPDMEPMERLGNRAIDMVVGPATQKGIEELSTQTAALQGQISFVNPGYELDGYGIFGTGFAWHATIKLTGASANLAGSTQGAASQPVDGGR